MKGLLQRKFLHVVVILTMVLAIGPMSAMAEQSKDHKADATVQQAKAAQNVPKTGFEKRDGDGWTTTEEESQFLKEVASKSDRVTYSVVGTSNEHRPLNLVKVGFPKAPSDADIAAGHNILIMGTPHGNEPSGHEASLMLLRDLAFTDDPDLLETLKDATILFIPEPNPDGREANTRGNADGIDNNRDHLKLETPEIQAVESVINKFQPDIVVDAHERPSAKGNPDLEVLWARNFNVDKPLYEISKEMVQDYVRPDVENAGFTTGLYGNPPGSGSGSEQILRNMSGLRHSIGLLTEAPGQQEPKRRVEMQRAAMDSVLNFYHERFDEVTGITEQSKVNKEEDGANQKPFYLSGTRDWDQTEYPPTILDPAPKGYLITDSQAEDINRHIHLFSLKTEKVGNNGIYVSMKQPMMTIVPLLMDHGADFNEVDGIPIYDTDNPGTAGNAKSLADFYQEQGEFKNDQAAAKVIAHLTVIHHAEQLGQSNKVVKHLKGFKVLVGQQEQNENISDRAAHMLNNYADYLLEKWQ
ncbi:M14 family metallocarboxypeptidase [Virgibacillus halophilus]|uniref:M14 family metallocarboxypeptidase n=1 Tax=Tigheibacillus halophilus TaxID=361280 RepID=A0ABU5C320_9BACI|nr:M14 family metallocarboxypeptidase [Virgibacillus halophilus]